MKSLEKTKNKIFTNAPAAKKIINLWHKNGEKIVFTNGCFDILHLGHIELLLKASDMGNRLIIGLNSDESVKKIKGADRPFQDEHSRAMILASVEYVDMVIFFSEETPYKLIKAIRPDILVKGGDYKAEDIVGYDIVTKNRGKVKIIKYLKGYSTTGIAENMSRII